MLIACGFVTAAALITYSVGGLLVMLLLLQSYSAGVHRWIVVSTRRRGVTLRAQYLYGKFTTTCIGFTFSLAVWSPTAEVARCL